MLMQVTPLLFVIEMKMVCLCKWGCWLAILAVWNLLRSTMPQVIWHLVEKMEL